MAAVAQPFRAAKNAGLKPCATQVENALVTVSAHQKRSIRELK
jgi:hypothetical protein